MRRIDTRGTFGDLREGAEGEGPAGLSLLEKGLSLDLREVEGESGSTGLLVPAQDDAAMAEALLTLLCDPALARRMGERAREEARQRFGAAGIAQETYALYQRVLDARTGGSR